MTAEVCSFLRARLDEEQAALDVKRKLLEDFPPITAEDRAEAGEWDKQIKLTETVLHVLSLPYADHPDYRPEWRDLGNA